MFLQMIDYVTKIFKNGITKLLGKRREKNERTLARKQAIAITHRYSHS